MGRRPNLALHLLLFATLLALTARAVAAIPVIPRDDPEQLLRQTTSELLAISRAARDYAEQDHNRYYQQVSAILDQVLDADYLARGVMATYASARLYRSLQTDAEKQQFRERVKQFSTALQQVLIEKYADALLAFKGEKIDIENLGDKDSGGGKVSLLQTIHAENNVDYRVQYNLSRQKDGSWLINNVIVEGVNLGATYRTQFAEAVEKNKGDVDYVVNNWVKLMTPAKTADAPPEANPGNGDHQP